MSDEFKMPTQKELQGMETPEDKQVTAAAKRYANARDERMAAGEKEATKKALLIDLMRDKGLKKYLDKNANVLVITDPGKPNVKVRIDAVDAGE